MMAEKTSSGSPDTSITISSTPSKRPARNSSRIATRPADFASSTTG
jgi:hypothetical protein